MQFALQALPFSRHAQNDLFFAHATVDHGLPSLPLARAAVPRPAASGIATARTGQRPIRLPLRPVAGHGGVRILRNEGQAQGGRLLISGRMADVCAALNRLDCTEYACG